MDCGFESHRPHMKYQLHDSSGDFVESGETDLKGLADIDVPTHGGIALWIEDQWITFRTSEWLIIDVGDKPHPWYANLS